MPPLLAIVQALSPLIAAAAFLAAVVVWVNRHGSKLTRHDEWLAKLTLQVGNLHKDREARHVQSLQLKREPPPLSEARTVEVGEDLLLTLKREMQRKDTDDDG
jgi:hypothetical protein